MLAVNLLMFQDLQNISRRKGCIWYCLAVLAIMISFAVVEISLLFRCILISGKQAGLAFCGVDGEQLIGWANGVVFCLLPTLPVPVPSFS